MNEEMWRKFPLNKRYFVSTDGRVWSSKTRRFLKPYPNSSHGYLYVSIPNISGKTKFLAIHRMVAVTFIGACPAGLETAHLNGIKTDNRLANLQYVTRSENGLMRNQHGTMLKGESHWQTKLTADEVREMREKYIRGTHDHGVLALSKEYGVSVSTAHRIVSGQTWGHLDKITELKGRDGEGK